MADVPRSFRFAAGILAGLMLLPSLLPLHDSALGDAVSREGQSLPSPRIGMAAAVDADRVYLFGGWDGATLAQVVRFNATTSAMQILPHALPSPRLGAAAAWDPRTTPACPRGCAYVFGGWSGTFLDEVIRFNASSGVSTHLPAVLPSPRWGMAAAWDAAGGVAFLFGGENREGPLADILRFDPLSGSLERAGAALPAGRVGASAVLDPHDRPAAGCPAGCVFLFGGKGQQALPVLRYNPTADALLPLDAELPSARAYAGATWDPRSFPSLGCAEGCAYVLGGERTGPAGTRRLDEILRFDPLTETLVPVHARLPLGVCCAAAAAVDGDAFLFGGWNETATNAIHRFSVLAPLLRVAGVPRLDAVDLAWEAPPAEAGAASYELRREPPFSPPEGPLSETNFTDSSLASGAHYCYRVAARDGDGMRGPWSNELCLLGPREQRQEFVLGVAGDFAVVCRSELDASIGGACFELTGKETFAAVSLEGLLQTPRVSTVEFLHYRPRGSIVRTLTDHRADPQNVAVGFSCTVIDNIDERTFGNLTEARDACEGVDSTVESVMDIELGVDDLGKAALREACSQANETLAPAGRVPCSSRVRLDAQHLRCDEEVTPLDVPRGALFMVVYLDGPVNGAANPESTLFCEDDTVLGSVTAGPYAQGTVGVLLR